eukprot:3606320-Pyramimonas_sp.AAC.2
MCFWQSPLEAKGLPAGEAARPVFTVFPESAELKPHASHTFRVGFRPGKDGHAYFHRLECVAYLKAMRNFRLVTEETISPPWCLTIGAAGTTTATAAEDFMPKVYIKRRSITLYTFVLLLHFTGANNGKDALNTPETLPLFLNPCPALPILSPLALLASHASLSAWLPAADAVRSSAALPVLVLLTLAPLSSDFCSLAVIDTGGPVVANAHRPRLRLGPTRRWSSAASARSFRRAKWAAPPSRRACCTTTVTPPFASTFRTTTGEAAVCVIIRPVLFAPVGTLVPGATHLGAAGGGGGPGVRPVFRLPGGGRGARWPLPVRPNVTWPLPGAGAALFAGLRGYLHGDRPVRHQRGGERAPAGADGARDGRRGAPERQVERVLQAHLRGRRDHPPGERRASLSPATDTGQSQEGREHNLDVGANHRDS